jgi:hypothetical protein
MTQRPAHGVRFALDLAPDGEGADVVYRGFAHLPEADLPLEVRVGEAGATASLDASAAPSAPRAELERAAAALVRAAVRAPLAEGRRPPRRVVRWR